MQANGERGGALRRMRLLRGMKQSHLAECLGVTQSTVSRWESGSLPLPDVQWRLARRALAPLVASVEEAVLVRLVEQSRSRVHLICDRTHRLIAASPARCENWRIPYGRLKGQPMLPYASPEILKAESTLAGLGWHEGRVPRLVVATGPNARGDVPILPGRVLWERVGLGDGAAGRLVTTLEGAPAA